MKILSVDLQNIRSHLKTGPIRFGEGLNIIQGGVGKGKSSILYAIDFSFTGEKIGRTFNYLLRSESRRGTVKLTFEKGRDKYIIIRELKREGRGIKQVNPWLIRSGRIVAKGMKEAVNRELKDVLDGLEPRHLREILFVRQEELKTILNLKPEERQKRIDSLLGIEVFKNAFENLAPVVKRYEGENRSLNAVISVLEREEGKIKPVEEKIKREERKLKEIKGKEEKLIREINNLRREIEEYEGVEKKINDLSGRKESLKEKIELRLRDVSRDEKQLQNLSNEKVEIEKEIKKLRSERERTGNPEEIEREIEELEAREKEITGICGELSEKAKGLEGDLGKIKPLMGKGKCPLCGQELKEEHVLKLIEQYTSDLEKVRLKLREALNERGSLESRVKSMKEKLGNIRGKVREIEKREVKLNSLENEIKGLKERINHFKVEIGINKQIFEKLVKEEKGLRERFSHLLKKDYEKLKGELKVLEEERRKRVEEASEARTNIKNWRRELGELKRKMEELNMKRERLKKTSRILDFLKQTRELYKAVRAYLRSEYIKTIEANMQRIVDYIRDPERNYVVYLKNDYSPVVKVDGEEREVSSLSGGERTILAIAYRIALSQTVYTAKTGKKLGVLILDEPTESLGHEDESINRLGEMLRNLKDFEQIIAVSHSEHFTDYADHLIRVKYEAGRSILY